MRRNKPGSPNHHTQGCPPCTQLNYYVCEKSSCVVLSLWGLWIVVVPKIFLPWQTHESNYVTPYQVSLICCNCHHYLFLRIPCPSYTQCFAGMCVCVCVLLPSLFLLSSFPVDTFVPLASLTAAEKASPFLTGIVTPIAPHIPLTMDQILVSPKFSC